MEDHLKHPFIVWIMFLFLILVLYLVIDVNTIKLRDGTMLLRQKHFIKYVENPPPGRTDDKYPYYER